MCVFQKSATVEEETNDDELYKNIVERASGYTDYPYYPRVPTTSAPGDGLGPCQPHCRALTRPKPQTTRTAETPLRSTPPARWLASAVRPSCVVHRRGFALQEFD